MESDYRQFRNTGEMRGFPLISDDGGVGIMQITSPPPNRNQYWNWRMNVDGGKDILQQKWNASNDWFNDRLVDGWPEPTTINRLFDTYCRYNGGHYYSNPPLEPAEPCPPCYHRNHNWNNECGVCNPAYPQADFNIVAQQCEQSGCCYADDAMGIH
jgi:hypothetical protein